MAGHKVASKYSRVYLCSRGVLRLPAPSSRKSPLKRAHSRFIKEKPSLAARAAEASSLLVGEELVGEELEEAPSKADTWGRPGVKPRNIER